MYLPYSLAVALDGINLCLLGGQPVFSLFLEDFFWLSSEEALSANTKFYSVAKGSI